MNEKASTRWYRNAFLIAIGLSLIVVAAFVARRAGQRAAEIKALDEAEPKVVANYEQAKQAFEQGKIGGGEFVEFIQAGVLAPWREIESRLRKLRDRESSEEVAARLDRRLKAMKLREQAWGLIVDSLREGSEEGGMAQAARKAAKADQIEAEIAAESEAAAKKAKK